METDEEPYLPLYEHGSADPTLVGSRSANLAATDRDLAELTALGLIQKAEKGSASVIGLIQQTGRGSYVVTNAGRAVYDRLKNPPPERPPVGFTRD